jgi:ABC-type nitrate/sulfonate/bicarbonate transport system substrate-binding protein
MSTGRHGARVSAASVLLALAFASSIPLATAAGPPPSQIVKATICIAARTDTTLPIFAAQDGGYLEEEHIQATLPYFAGGRVDAAFVAGQCDLALNAGGEGPLLTGADVVAVAATTVRPPFEIWARPEIPSIAGLKGHKLGTSGPGSLSWRLGRYYLRLNHLVPNTDVILVPISSAATTVGALVSGRVDAAVLSPPLTAEVENQGMRLLYAPPDDVRFIVQAIITSRRYLSSHPAVVRGVVAAAVKAMKRLQEDRAFYAAELARFTNLHVAGEKLQQYWTTARREYNIPPLATHADAVTALSLYSDAARNVDLNSLATRWLDMSIVNELYPH